MTDPKRNIDLNCMHCGKPMMGHPRYCFPEERIPPWLAALFLAGVSVVGTVVYVAQHFIRKFW